MQLVTIAYSKAQYIKTKGEHNWLDLLSEYGQVIRRLDKPKALCAEPGRLTPAWFQMMRGGNAKC